VEYRKVERISHCIRHIREKVNGRSKAKEREADADDCTGKRLLC
jgi:hypothetical protein